MSSLHNQPPSGEEYRRLEELEAKGIVLFILADLATAQVANERVLHRTLDGMGFKFTRERLSKVLGELAEGDFVALRKTPDDHTTVAELRERGADLVEGRIRHETIGRPRYLGNTDEPRRVG